MAKLHEKPSFRQFLSFVLKRRVRTLFMWLPLFDIGSGERDEDSRWGERKGVTEHSIATYLEKYGKQYTQQVKTWLCFRGKAVKDV